jgi:hypothetical protein
MPVPRCYVEADDGELRLAFALAVWYLSTRARAGYGDACPVTWHEPSFSEWGEPDVPTDFSYSCRCDCCDAERREIPPAHYRCDDDCPMDGDSFNERRPDECIQEYMLSLARAILREHPRAAELQEPDYKTLYGGEGE